MRSGVALACTVREEVPTSWWLDVALLPLVCLGPDIWEDEYR